MTTADRLADRLKEFGDAMAEAAQFAKDAKHGILLIDNERKKVTADYALRFVDGPDGAIPVLYHAGKRVAQAWSMALYCHVDADKNRNANTT